jgi:hypothetical protein
VLNSPDHGWIELLMQVSDAKLNLRRCTSVVHVAILLSVYLSLSLLLVLKTQGLPSWDGVSPFRSSEHYSAYLHGYNLWRFGITRSFGLVDASTGSRAVDHPLVYVHGNLLPSRLLVSLLLLLGVGSIYHQTLLFVLVSAAWVPCAYFACRRLFTPRIAFLSVLLLATQFHSILMASVNLCRGWHAVIFFGVLWASLRYAGRVLDALLLAALLIVAIHFELALAAVCVVLSFYGVYIASRRWWSTALVVLTPAVIALALQATQVALYLGGPHQLLSYATRSFTTRTGLSALDDTVFQQYAQRRIVFWPISANVPKIARRAPIYVARLYREHNGTVVMSLVVVSYLALFGACAVSRWKGSRGELGHARLAAFVTVGFGAIGIAFLLFPSAVWFYAQNDYPLLVFFLFLGLPYLVEWARSLVPRLPVFALSASLLVVWGWAQFQAYQHERPRPDGMVRFLRAQYCGSSFGTSMEPWNAVWFAVQSDVALIDPERFPRRPPTLPDLTNGKESSLDYLLVSRDQARRIPSLSQLPEDRSYGDSVILRLRPGDDSRHVSDARIACGQTARI